MLVLLEHILLSSEHQLQQVALAVRVMPGHGHPLLAHRHAMFAMPERILTRGPRRARIVQLAPPRLPASKVASLSIVHIPTLVCNTLSIVTHVFHMRIAAGAKASAITQ